jgi:hypothetical protein
MMTSGHPVGALPLRGSERYVQKGGDPAGEQESASASLKHSIRAGGIQVPWAPDSHAELKSFECRGNPAASAAVSPAFGFAPGD